MGFEHQFLFLGWKVELDSLAALSLSSAAFRRLHEGVSASGAAWLGGFGPTMPCRKRGAPTPRAGPSWKRDLD